MKDRIIAAIISDRTRVLTLLVSSSISLSGMIAAKWFGVDLTVDQQATITLIVTLVFGWIIEGYAAEKNAQGAEKVQQALQIQNPELDADRYIGPKTIAAAQDMAVDSVTKKTQ
jgi:hypothetical protein